MTLGQVAEAVLVGREQQSMDSGDQFRDVHDLLDLCSSFVCLAGTKPPRPLFELSRKQTDGQQIVSDAYLVLRLAHTSVKEYILSDRTNIASLSMHRLTSGNAQRFMAEVCLIHLNQFGKQTLFWSESVRRHPFLIYTTFNWLSHYGKMAAEEKDSVADLLLTLRDTHHYGNAYIFWGDSPEAKPSIDYRFLQLNKYTIELSTVSAGCLKCCAIFRYPCPKQDYCLFYSFITEQGCSSNSIETYWYCFHEDRKE